jgi:hypothetical protein
VTPFERAVVAAYLARKEHGPRSSEYGAALDQLEIERIAETLRRRRGEEAGVPAPGTEPPP